MHEEPRLEEQILSKVAEIGLSTKLDASEKIDVDVQTDLLKLILGNADSVEVAGQGLVIQKDIRVQEIELHTDSLHINPVSAIFGQVELDQPLDATVRIVLTEQDINRALNSDYILNNIPTLELNVDGQRVKLEMQQMELLLPGTGRMVIKGKTLLHEVDNTRQVDFTASFRPRKLSQPVLLEKFNCTEGQSVSLEFAVALLQKLKEITHLPYLELETMALRLEEIEVQEGSLTLQAKARVRQLPS
jgi:hypothetical protein